MTSAAGRLHDHQREVTVTKTNKEPTAAFTYTCDQLACSFDGSGSSDPDGPIDSYSWDFDGAGTSTVAKPDFTFASAGDKTVTLTVKDPEGLRTRSPRRSP